MLLVAAKTILIAVAVFFLLLGLISLVRPNHARRFLLGFAASAPKHYAELCARFVAGGAMLVVALYATHSAALNAFGWLIILTTAVMAIVPWRVHRQFTEAAVPKALRFLPIIGVTSVVLGGLLLWSVFTANAA
jgi:uncharacterized protein YjeT (DUF2065 family)